MVTKEDGGDSPLIIQRIFVLEPIKVSEGMSSTYGLVKHLSQVINLVKPVLCSGNETKPVSYKQEFAVNVHCF